MLELVYSYLVLGAFFMVEFMLRRNTKTTGVLKPKSDGRSTMLIIIALLSVLVLSLVCNYYLIGTFDNQVASIVALIIMFIGLFIRIWSMISLKKYYTRNLQLSEHQPLVIIGPYKIIRHPGYLGTLLIWLLAGLAVQNYIVFIVAIILLIPLYLYRINKEERMLIEHFGQQYLNYKNHTWRLIPLVW
jgi:protein-S-isoprenylcysteine O-methyltransferase Ste14